MTIFFNFTLPIATPKTKTKNNAKGLVAQTIRAFTLIKVFILVLEIFRLDFFFLDSNKKTRAKSVS